MSVTLQGKADEYNKCDVYEKQIFVATNYASISKLWVLCFEEKNASYT